MAEGEKEHSKEEKVARFLDPDEMTGEIRTTEKKRAVVVTADFWRALIGSMEERLSAEFDDVLYSAGQRWGTHTYSEFAKEVSSSQKTLYHTRNMGLSDFKDQFNAYLIRHGWGRFDIYEKYDLIFVDLLHSVFPEMEERSETMTCSLMAGFFAGFFAELIGVELSCIELRCASTGAEKCTFVVADSSLTVSVRKWLSKGRSFEEIVEAIGAREYQGKR